MEVAKFKSTRSPQSHDHSCDSSRSLEFLLRMREDTYPKPANYD
jgi:hypothetical protein